jgi:aryl-alcohol dehydrogenase-like predicted oxidoreductase
MPGTLDTVPLGTTGLEVSELAFGTWRFGRESGDGVEIDRERGYDLLDTFADHGGSFIDTADTYGDGFAETLIGDWLADRDREDYVVASKIYRPTAEGNPNCRGLNRRHLRRQLRAVLERLETDYLDVLYVHRWDDRTPAAEFMRTLDGFVADGRVDYLGIATERPNAWKVVKANEIARREGYERFAVAQPRYNLLDRAIEGPYLDMCRDYGLGVVPWSPLAGGVLTGKYRRDDPPPAGSRAAREPAFGERYLVDETFDVLDELRAVADETGSTPAQVALAWLLEHDAVTAPVLGARTVEQLTEDLAVTDRSLSEEQFARLTAARPGDALSKEEQGR